MNVLELVLMILAGIWQGIRHDLNLLELAVLAAGWWLWKNRRLPAAGLPRFNHPWRTATFLALGTVLLRLALLPVLPVPTPRVTDEHSHLLLADTLLHGRLANPPHPFWSHFESLHIIQQPHYVSSYFPGHAVWLAAGALLGSAWFGVLAELVAFLLLLYWMLRGYCPPRWALFGCLLAGLRLGIGSYWINAFHGGLLPALGGALVLGAFARLNRRFGGVNAVALGAGLSTLMVTRPFEGLFFALPVIGALVWRYRRSAWDGLRLAAVVLLLTGSTAVLLGTYFKAITGSPVVTAYQISQKMYGWPMTMAWAKPPSIQHRHLELAHYYQYEIDEREKVASIPGFLEFSTFRIQEYWRFFLGPVLTIPILVLFRRYHRRTTPLLAFAGCFAAVMLEGAASPHYLAPATAAILLFIVDGCRRIASVWRVSPWVFPASVAAILVVRIALAGMGLPYTQKVNYQSWCCRVDANGEREKIAAKLSAKPGQHLVFVRAKTDPYNFEQWIYNAAEIDAARIVWARDLGESENSALCRYYPRRAVWLVDPNQKPPAWGPYPNAGSANSSASE